MRESESFDAFYARTVANVTSQMHALAAGDPQADHAIREAYARAYQQWFEVSGFRDTEVWVLDVAREAFERRRAQPFAGPAQAPDTGTWPGMYRQRTPAANAPADPDATVGQPGAGLAGAGLAGAGLAGAGLAGAGLAGAGHAGAGEPGLDQAGAIWADRAQTGGRPGSIWAGAAEAGGMPESPAAAGTAPRRPGWPVRRGRVVMGKPVIAVLAVIALLAAGGAYLAFGGKNPGTGAGNTPPAAGGSKKPQVRMLPAGKTGTRSSVPWSLVGAGWTLAEFSTAAPSSTGQPTGGSSATDLVDPDGGRYSIYQWPAGDAPQLIAWSGNGASALFGTGSGYTVLTVKTGQPATLTLPAGVTAFGFTRPDGLNILAVQQGPARYKLQRYSLTGTFQATLATMPRRAAPRPWPEGCTSSCAAISSPDGDTAVWAVNAGGMEVVSNAGGGIVRLHAPGSGRPAACTPLSWWNQGTILASCDVAGSQGTATRLWLMPESGSSPSPLTAALGAGSGDLVITGAWQAAGQVYVTSTDSAQCPSAPSGPGGLGILLNGSSTAVTVSGSTGDHNAIIGSSGVRLLVLAQTSCPGTSSLLWLSPSSGATQALLTAPSTEAGVVAAVPYGFGTSQAGN
jgi:hypothetical protein